MISYDVAYKSNFLMDELRTALSKLKNKTATGPDQIHNRMLIELPEPAVNYILKSYNKL